MDTEDSRSSKGGWFPRPGINGRIAKGEARPSPASDWSEHDQSNDRRERQIVGNSAKINAKERRCPRKISRPSLSGPVAPFLSLPSHAVWLAGECFGGLSLRSDASANRRYTE